MDGYIATKNIKIYLREDINENSNKAILLIHGFFEHSGKYNDFILNLKKLGYSVFATDLRGHGRTISKKGDLKSIKKVLDDVDLIVKYIKEKYKFDKFGIFAHSTGGLISSIFASLYKEKLDFLILTSPAVFCPKKYKKIKYIPYKILPFLKLKREIKGADEYTLKSFSIRSIGVIFVEGVNLLNKVLDIKCPTLLLCGKEDDLLDEPDKFIEFSKRIGPTLTFKMYEDAKHRIVHNEGNEARIKDIIEWLNTLL